MRILICSDGTDPADHPTRLGGMVAQATRASVTLLGIAETPVDEEPLRAALESEVAFLRSLSLAPELRLRAGEPIAQTFEETTAAKYDLVVIGAPRKRTSGLHWR